MANVQRARRIPNANGQVLIENWVEERAVHHVDHQDDHRQFYHADTGEITTESVSPPTIKKTAHVGLLTQSFDAPLSDATIYRDNYNKFGPFEYKPQGARRRQAAHALTREVAAELKARKREYDENLRQERVNQANSEYQLQFTKQFESKPPPTTQPHHLTREMPVSFWTEHRQTASGVTQLKTFNSPFHRNASFSTPVEQSFEGSRPHEMEQWPTFAQKSLNDAKIC